MQRISIKSLRLFDYILISYLEKLVSEKINCKLMLYRSKSDIKIETIRCYLRHPHKSDYKSWRDLREASRDFLIPWEPSWPNRVHERSHFNLWLKFIDNHHKKVSAQFFFIFEKKNNNLLGGLNILEIFYGIKMYGRLGYWIGRPYANQGYMTEAIIGLCDYTFSILDLNRLDSACLPRNIASNKVLLKCGFTKEGLLKSLYRINGKFEDHNLYAKINPNHLSSYGSFE